MRQLSFAFLEAGEHIPAEPITGPSASTLKSEPVVLRRVDPRQNMARFYSLGIGRNLFGSVVLVRHWGRIGTHGKARFDEHPDQESARAALTGLMLAKQRRGYRDDLPSIRPPTVQRDNHDGSTFAPVPVDEAVEPPLPF
jgi:predicted DNA-binding WGR domain protein